MDSCCSSSSSRYLHPLRSLDGRFAQPDYDNIKFAEYLNGFMREYQSTLLQPKLRYTVLKEADIRERQLQCMTEVCSKLRVSRSSAIILLRHCNWNVSMLFDKWFKEEDDVRNKLGLFRNVPLVDQSVAYVRESISNDGVGCLSLKCHHPGSAVGEDLILPVLATKANSDPDKAKYSQYLLRSQSDELRYSAKWMMLKNEDDSEGVD
ncbi:hypothetical protein ACFXTO_044044 [Malus domestica]